MKIYSFELICIVANILSGFNQLKLNHKVSAILNFVLAGILIVLTVIMAIQDIKTYFYNKEIEKKYNKSWEKK